MANSCKGQETPVTSIASRDPQAQYQEPGYFQFPFIPYDIQVEFMKELYSVLEKGGIGIFESPTGTGKSLSLICGALTWLRDNEEKCKKKFDTAEDDIISESKIISAEVSTSADSEPAWVSEVASQRAKKILLDQMKAKQEKEKRYAERLARIKKKNQNTHKGKRKHDDHENELDKIEEQLINELNEEDKKDEDSELILTEYHSDGDFGNADSSSDEEDENDIHVTKIYYCSRTHSQLDQFVKEVKKSPFGNSTRVVSLGSRLNLCINKDVKKLRSITRVNDRCLELQKLKKGKQKQEAQSHKKSKAKSGCPFYDHKRLQDYKDLILVDVKDVEELISIGQETKACPYYGSRYAIPIAELVVLPYNMLLHQATREACGIKLKDNIVIIDEAHNLIETISNIHSVEITGVQISRAHSQLLQYRDKYGSRLKAKNLMYVKQILHVLSCFLSCFDKSSLKQDGEKESASNKADAKLFTINDFLFSARIDNVNLFKIKRYCERSMISKKLNGFVDKYNTTLLCKEGQLSSEEEYIPTSSPLQNIESFLECLTNANKDGRIFLNNQVKILSDKQCSESEFCDLDFDELEALLSQCSLKFLLLNPAVYFKSVVEEARTVVVAGGTMQPVSEFKQQLLYSCSLSPDDVSEFVCGHVIPEDHLLPIALAKGPSGVDLDYTYKFRDGKEMVLEVSRVLTNLCTVVPGGLVCFFPSYDYKEKVVKQWCECGAFQKIDAKKKIFSEPRKACHVEKTLLDYGNFIKRTQSSHGRSSASPNGAILLCVIGGKMSEGINFSDDLGRCVVVIGLPYPNIHSPELKEYVSYLDATLGSKAGQQHCENVCMKAVNQSIGRAIRHINDYSTIVLLDQRYARSSVQKKLPAWISSRLQTHTGFGPAFVALKKFFTKRSIQTKDSV